MFKNPFFAINSRHAKYRKRCVTEMKNRLKLMYGKCYWSSMDGKDRFIMVDDHLTITVTCFFRNQKDNTIEMIRRDQHELNWHNLDIIESYLDVMNNQFISHDSRDATREFINELYTLAKEAFYLIELADPLRQYAHHGVVNAQNPRLIHYKDFHEIKRGLMVGKVLIHAVKEDTPGLVKVIRPDGSIKMVCPIETIFVSDILSRFEVHLDLLEQRFLLDAFDTARARTRFVEAVKKLYEEVTTRYR